MLTVSMARTGTLLSTRCDSTKSRMSLHLSTSSSRFGMFSGDHHAKSEIAFAQNFEAKSQSRKFPQSRKKETAEIESFNSFLSTTTKHDIPPYLCRMQQHSLSARGSR